jgi:hypothetical protein
MRTSPPGLADLSLVVLASRLDTRRLARFDLRRFRDLRPLAGGAFELLPELGWDPGSRRARC